MSARIIQNDADGYVQGSEEEHDDASSARIRKGVADGDVPEGTDCDMLAAYYSAVARGLAVQARDGASRSSRQERVAGREEWPIKLARRLMRLMSGMISR